MAKRTTNPYALESEIISLQKDATYLSQHVGKLDSTIEKIASLAGDMSKLLAVHEQRFSKTEEVLEKLVNLSDKHREEIQAKVDKVYSDMDARDNVIVKEVREHLASRKADTDKQFSEISVTVGSIKKSFDKFQRVLWMCLGGSAVFFFLLSHIDFIIKIVKS